MSDTGKKLDWTTVTEMRENYASGMSQGMLSRKYGVSVGTVGRIMRNESWQREGASLRLPGSAYSPPKPVTPENYTELLMRHAKPAVEEMLQEISPPPSLLDGGDAPDETAGTGISALQQRAKELGLK